MAKRAYLFFLLFRYLEKLCQELNVSDRVTFLGRISDLEVKEAYRSAKLCLLATEKEGWGFVAMEAQAYGCPVIAFDVPGIRDSVINGKTGTLINYGNKDSLRSELRKISLDPTLLKYLSSEAISRAKMYDWESCYGDFLFELTIVEKE